MLLFRLNARLVVLLVITVEVALHQVAVAAMADRAIRAEAGPLGIQVTAALVVVPAAQATTALLAALAEAAAAHILVISNRTVMPDVGRLAAAVA